MVKVTFRFDKEKDIFNLWETAFKKTAHGKDFSKNMPSDLVKQIEFISLEKAKPIIGKYFAKNYASGLIEISVKSVDSAWRKIEKEYFSRMDKLFGKKLSAKKIIARMTTAPRCPYDPSEKSFMINFYASIPANLLTAGHEIMHLYFHEHYFKKISLKIGAKKAHDIKEAFTILLNPTCYDLWFARDRGYESHSELRKFILEEWKKENDVDKLLEKCIAKLKNEEVK